MLTPVELPVHWTAMRVCRPITHWAAISHLFCIRVVAGAWQLCRVQWGAVHCRDICLCQNSAELVSGVRRCHIDLIPLRFKLILLHQLGGQRQKQHAMCKSVA